MKQPTGPMGACLKRPLSSLMSCKFEPYSKRKWPHYNFLFSSSIALVSDKVGTWEKKKKLPTCSTLSACFPNNLIFLLKKGKKIILNIMIASENILLAIVKIQTEYTERRTVFI
jgi:hypothetical protein